MSIKSPELIRKETEFLEKTKDYFIKKMEERIACNTASKRKAYLKQFDK